MDSAFLILTMGGLSSNPTDETNNLLRLLLLGAANSTLLATDLNPPFAPAPGVVRQNCVFFASLFSSLLAAAGAVLAKQWLAIYQRTGQTGPLDEQGIRRTQKFLGAERWKLRWVVEALPTLILVSLGLFFIAIADYVWSLNEEVAILITAFSAVGTASYIATLFAAALYPQCPFQTAPSAALNEILAVILRVAISAARNFTMLPIIVVLNIARAVTRWTSGIRPVSESLRWLQTAVVPKWSPIRLPPIRGGDVQEMRSGRDSYHVESALAMLSISPHRDIVITVAQNITAITDIQSMQRLASRPEIYSLAETLNTMLLSFQKSGSDVEQDQALTIARALLHILLADPTQCGWNILVRLRVSLCQDSNKTSGLLPSADLKILCLCIIRLCASAAVARGEYGYGVIPSTPLVQRDLPRKLMQESFIGYGTLSSSTVERYLHQYILLDSTVPPKELRCEIFPFSDEHTLWLTTWSSTLLGTFRKSLQMLLSDDSIPTTNSFLSLSSCALSISLKWETERDRDGPQPPPPKFEAYLQQAWSTRSG